MVRNSSGLSLCSFSHDVLFYPFLKRQIFDSSKLKEFTDDNFKYDEYVRMFFKRVENTYRRGEIARSECSPKGQKTPWGKGEIAWSECSPKGQKKHRGKSRNCLVRIFSERAENTVGKREIARYEQFLLFPTVFSKDLYCRHEKPGLGGEKVKL